MTVLFCWSERPTGICGGKLDWRHEDGYWRSRCPKCRAESRAASGEAAKLDAMVQVSS